MDLLERLIVSSFLLLVLAAVVPACPSGFEYFSYRGRAHCYQMNLTADTFQNAWNLCNSYGATVAVVSSATKTEDLANYVWNKRRYNQQFWIGECSNGTVLISTETGATAPPNNKNCSYLLVASSKTGSWYPKNLMTNTVSKCFVCEKVCQPPTAPSPLSLSSTTQPRYSVDSALSQICPNGTAFTDGRSSKPLICHHDGTWEDFDTNCVGACSAPSYASNTVLSPPQGSYLVGSTVNVQCVAGWLFPNGDSAFQLSCVANNTWSNSTPSGGCSLSTCPSGYSSFHDRCLKEVSTSYSFFTAWQSCSQSIVYTLAYCASGLQGQNDNYSVSGFLNITNTYYFIGRYELNGHWYSTIGRTPVDNLDDCIRVMRDNSNAEQLDDGSCNSQRKSVCEKVCGTPPSVPNMVLSASPGNTSIVGTTVVYLCSNSSYVYSNNGPNYTVTCGNGAWGPIPAPCIPGCAKPSVASTSLQPDSAAYSVGSRVMAICTNDSHRFLTLSDRPTGVELQCTAPGVWANIPSQGCSLPNCSASILTSFAGASASPNQATYNAGTSVTITCSSPVEAFLGTANNSLAVYCDAEGYWQDLPPGNCTFNPALTTVTYGPTTQQTSTATTQSVVATTATQTTGAVTTTQPPGTTTTTQPTGAVITTQPAGTTTTTQPTDAVTTQPAVTTTTTQSTGAETTTQPAGTTTTTHPTDIGSSSSMTSVTAVGLDEPSTVADSQTDGDSTVSDDTPSTTTQIVNDDDTSVSSSRPVHKPHEPPTPPVDPCLSSPCSNSATCHSHVDGFICECPTRVKGYFCEIIAVGECRAENCENKAACFISQNGDYLCECKPGFEEARCEKNIDECASSPCVYGQCKDAINYFTCACDNGFTGTLCEYEIDECESQPCRMNGTCTDAIADYKCSCSEGFTGKSCEVNVDDCASGPCHNGGHCEDGVKNYTCECSTYFKGSHCEIQSQQLTTIKAASQSFAVVAIVIICSLLFMILIVDLAKLFCNKYRLNIFRTSRKFVI